MSYLEILESAWQEHLKPRAKDAPTVISTFAGAGGSSLGYSMAGFRELLAVEWDNNAVETFKLNFPNVPVYHGDIAKLSVDECLNLAKIQPRELDVFDGSPPCQGFSTAGKRIMDDPRNQLFREYVRLLRGLQPKVFVMENVSGMVKGKMKLIFVEILKELKASGYQVSARLLNAMYFNVPQSRERMIFIGVREDLDIAPTHPKAESSLFTVKDSIADLLYKPRDESIGHIWYPDAERKTKNYFLALKARQGQKFAGQQTRKVWNKPCPTLQTPGGSLEIAGCLRNIGCHPIRTRTFSIREYARIGSFADEFRLMNHLCFGFKQVGNSVPPLFMRSIARHIRFNILDKSSATAEPTKKGAPSKPRRVTETEKRNGKQKRA